MGQGKERKNEVTAGNEEAAQTNRKKGLKSG
jgi:hypothetical protein